VATSIGCGRSTSAHRNVVDAGVVFKDRL